MNSKKFLSSFLFSSLLFSVFSISCDSSEAWQMTFQDPATPLMEGIVDLHHGLMFIVIFIVAAIPLMILSLESVGSYHVTAPTVGNGATVLFQYPRPHISVSLLG